MSEVKLKRCPFCDKKLKRIRNGYEHSTSQCILSSFTFTEAEVKKWNTRKPIDEVLERLDERIAKHVENIDKFCDKKQYDMATKESYVKTECKIAQEIVKEVTGHE